MRTPLRPAKRTPKGVSVGLHQTLARTTKRRTRKFLVEPEQPQEPDALFDESSRLVPLIQECPEPRTPSSRGVWVLLVSCLVLTASVVVVFAVSRRTHGTPVSPRTERPFADSQLPTNTNSEIPSTPSLPRALDGVAVLDSALQTPILFAVSIDHMLDGRPYSGVNQAAWVFEVPAEANITRLLAIFTNDQQVSEIGPVRSIRPYMIDLARSLGAVVIHSGGSPEALKQLASASSGVLDINEFSQTNTFWRDTKRPGPHNLYTSSALLVANPSVRQTGPSALQSLLWSNTQEGTSNTETASKVLTIGYPAPYTARWRYQPDRSMFVRLHDQKTAEQTRDQQSVDAKTVVVQFTDVKILDQVGRRSVRLIGQGEAMVVSARGVEFATWKRENASDRFTLWNISGEQLSLDPGRVWWTVVPKGTKVSYE